MEFFRKAKAVRFRSHHNKYLLAGNDEESILQDREGTVTNAKWMVEINESGTAIRLKSCYGKYLTASNMPGRMGMKSKKVVQTLPETLDSTVEWEPIREGFKVKLKMAGHDEFLRANGGVPPWRNSITHDTAHRKMAKEWALWNIDVVEIASSKKTTPDDGETNDGDSEQPDSCPSEINMTSESVKSKVSDDSQPPDTCSSEVDVTGSPAKQISDDSLKRIRIEFGFILLHRFLEVSAAFSLGFSCARGHWPFAVVNLHQLPHLQTRPTLISKSCKHITIVQLTDLLHLILNPSAMEFFRNAKVVRFRSHHDKYLLADEDGETVTQDKDGTATNARWTVEFVSHAETLRFKSCYGKYLTASSLPFKPGLRGNKVLQTQPRLRLDSSLEWEPVREGVQVRLRTPYGQFLCANGGVPPWRNSITHDAPKKTVRQDWILWDVDVLKKRSDDDVTSTNDDAESSQSDEHISPREETNQTIELLGKRDKLRKEVKANVIRFLDKMNRVKLKVSQNKRPST